MPNELQASRFVESKTAILFISNYFFTFHCSSSKYSFLYIFRKKINFIKTTAVLHLKYDVTKNISMRLRA